MNSLTAKLIAMRAVRRMMWPNVGDILVQHNSACPSFAFYQVILRQGCYVKVRMLDDEISFDDRLRYCTMTPVRDDFLPTDMESTVVLRLRPDGGVGPFRPWNVKWKVWDGKPIIHWRVD